MHLAYGKCMAKFMAFCTLFVCDSLYLFSNILYTSTFLLEIVLNSISFVHTSNTLRTIFVWVRVKQLNYYDIRWTDWYFRELIQLVLVVVILVDVVSSAIVVDDDIVHSVDVSMAILVVWSIDPIKSSHWFSGWWFKWKFGRFSLSHTGDNDELVDADFDDDNDDEFGEQSIDDETQDRLWDIRRAVNTSSSSESVLDADADGTGSNLPASRKFCSNSNSCPIKFKFGEIIGRANFTNLYASISEIDLYRITYAMAMVALREMPAWQCNKTVDPLTRASSVSHENEENK